MQGAGSPRAFRLKDRQNVADSGFVVPRSLPVIVSDASFRPTISTAAPALSTAAIELMSQIWAWLTSTTSLKSNPFWNGWTDP